MNILWLFFTIITFEDLENWYLYIKNIFTESELKEKIVFQLLPSLKVQPG
jgi:hypothetical protein